MRRIRRWRKMTWVLIVWTAVMALWIAGAIASGTSDKPSADCVASAGKDLCNGAGDVGTGIAVVLLILLFFLGFFVLGLIWLMSRPKRRTCPACGEAVKKGLTLCGGCGHDFAAAAQAGATA